MTTVSICIPAYNQGQYIEEAVNSALSQRHSDFEVVVSNNHSTDATADILKRMTDPRVRVVSPPQFLKKVDNWNFAVSQARGRYVTVLCSDDRLEPDFSKELSDMLEKNPNVAFAHCATAVIDANGKKSDVLRPPHGSRIDKGMTALRYFLLGPKNTFVSTMFRKDAFDRAGGFPATFELSMDWSLWLRLLQLGDIAYNDHELAGFRSWGQGATAKGMTTQLREDVICVREASQALGDSAEQTERSIETFALRRMEAYGLMEEGPLKDEMIARTIEAAPTPRVKRKIEWMKSPLYRPSKKLKSIIGTVLDRTIKKIWWLAR